MVRDGLDSGAVLTIAQLVKARLDSGHTLRQLEASSGGVVAYTQFDKIAKGQISQWPRSAEAIEGMAHALGVDVRQVVLSYAAQFGIDVREQRSALASMLPAGAERLSIRQAQAIAAMVRAFVEEAGSDDGEVATIRREPVRSHDGHADAEPEDEGLPRAARTHRSPPRRKSHDA